MLSAPARPQKTMSGSGHTIVDILANQFGHTMPTVEILAEDVGFESVGCGMWVKVG